MHGSVQKSFIDWEDQNQARDHLTNQLGLEENQMIKVFDDHTTQCIYSCNFPELTRHSVELFVLLTAVWSDLGPGWRAWK